MIHEILHALGFWHEQSRPDRDDHVSIETENIQVSYATACVSKCRHMRLQTPLTLLHRVVVVLQDGRALNFAKMTGQVDSLGSPYDFGSIMHYPAYAFSKNGRDTIAPRRQLGAWEVMGQRVGMSPSDIQQLRLLYQCSTGSRTLGELTPDNLCSPECKCWELALGSCDSDDDCLGDLLCGTPPPLSLLPKGLGYEDRLPPYTATTGRVDCSQYCHAICCNNSHGVLQCPETCGTAPPYTAPEEIPAQMCVTESYVPTTASPTNEPTTQSPTLSPTPPPSRSPTVSKWYVDW